MLKTISIIVSGKVQGVFFRQHTLEKALTLGITGYVKNNPDGNVQIIATGNEDQLVIIRDWCKKGAPRAIVTSLEIKELALQTFSSFSILKV